MKLELLSKASRAKCMRDASSAIRLIKFHRIAWANTSEDKVLLLSFVWVDAWADFFPSAGLWLPNELLKWNFYALKSCRNGKKIALKLVKWWSSFGNLSKRSIFARSTLPSHRHAELKHTQVLRHKVKRATRPVNKLGREWSKSHLPLTRWRNWCGARKLKSCESWWREFFARDSSLSRSFVCANDRTNCVVKFNARHFL